MAATELEPTHSAAVVTKVDTAEVPSAAWGWSGESRRTARTAGWVVIVILLAMLFENQQGSNSGTGNVGYIFLILISIGLALVLIRDSIMSRKQR